MILNESKWLTDENIQSGVVEFLRQSGFDVEQVTAIGLQGQIDSVVLKYALSTRRVVVTHDADFGTLAIQQGEPFVGIVYLRPGHIDPAFTVQSVAAILAKTIDVTPPFIVVARRSADRVSIRIRQLGDTSK